VIQEWFCSSIRSLHLLADFVAEVGREFLSGQADF
jgi:hypothetical protein